jgi:hypothetical protein
VGIGELKATVSGINFGAVTVGQASTETMTFTNTGTGAVDVSGVTVTGQAFKLAGSGTFPITVAAGSVYSFQVQFRPSNVGNATGQVTVDSNVSAGGVPTISISGLGVQAAAVNPPTLSGISCTNSSMTGAGSDNCFVALSAPAGSGGSIVSLTSNNAAVKVPATVTVPANTTGIGFMATVAAVASTQSTILTATDSGVSESCALQLNAAQSLLTASADQISFGSVEVNSVATASMVLSSAGTEPVTIASTSLTGSGFSLSGLSLPVVLNPGQTIVLNLEFDPASSGNATGQLTITTNQNGGKTMVISLTGTGAATGPGSGTSGSGGGSSTPSLTSLSCSSASMTGSGTDSCAVTLRVAAPAGGVVVALASSSAAVTVPASVTIPSGAVGASFTVAAAAVTAAQTATLTATVSGGTQSFALQLNAAGAFLSASKTSVAFGTLSLNSLGTQTLTLTSSGTQPVTVNTAVLTGAGFTLTGITLPVVLNPGQSVPLQLEFVPSIAGAATGQLTIGSTATSGGTMVISLTGTGATPYQVELSWDAPGTSADAVAGYHVYRSLSGASSYQLLNAGLNLTTTFTDATVQDGQAYLYYVTSVDASGMESIPSGTFGVTIP